jgi:SET domain-containing protein
VPPDVLEILAARDIAAGEEITIHYQGEPGDADSVSFPTASDL